MTHALLRRSWLAGLAVAVTAVLAPGVAQAEPPSNDDFDNATAVTVLPFEATADLAEATRAPDDPTSCIGFGGRFVWFRYTAPADGIVKASQTPSNVYQPVLAAYTGARGALQPVPGVCSYGGAETFHVTAGETYHLMVGTTYSGGTTSVRLESVPPTTNDDFADAERVPGLPVTVPADLGRAGPEPGEPPTSCGQEATQSIWYVYTPASSRWVSVIPIGQVDGTVAAYHGSSLSELSELDCQVNEFTVFRAEVGETYYIRVSAPPADADRLSVEFRTAPALRPSVSTNQEPGSTFSDIYLYAGPGDPLGRAVVSGELRFGDGTSTPLTAEGFVQHRYAADGVYQLELSITTDDGRTGTGTSTVRIETHDVTVNGFTVPTKARAGQTKPITVSVTNNRYDETVEVELYKQVGSDFVRVGAQTQFMAAGRTTQLPFAYTFSAADATAGSVTFKAVVRLPYPSEDDNMSDNEKLASTTVS
jgi:hypothetical protein